MKIAYVATIRFPTEKAHGIQIAKMCEAFAFLGNEVSLFIPTRKNIIKEDPFLYYGIRKNFSIIYIDVPDLIFLGRVGFIVSRIIFGLKIKKLFKNDDYDMVYTRDENLAWILSSVAKDRIVWESHRGENNFFVRSIIEKNVPVITISRGLFLFYRNIYPKVNMIVAHDGVDFSLFESLSSKEDLRKKLSLPVNKKIVTYTGHLYSWKGVDTLAQAACFFSSDIAVLFVGGTDSDIRIFTEKYGNNSCIKILGRKPYKMIPSYLRASDILVIPNSGKVQLSRDFTSPLKLFEYMASDVPIVASDLSSIKEILCEDNCVFFNPDNEHSLFQKINNLLKDQLLAQKISSNAKEKVLNFSWTNRANKILDFFLRRNISDGVI